MCNDNFGIENMRKVALIRRALYGGKMAGHNFWVHTRACMKEVSFKSCQGDPDVQMRPLKKEDSTDVWEYFLLYTVVLLLVLAVGGRQYSIMKYIRRSYSKKNQSVHQIYISWR